MAENSDLMAYYICHQKVTVWSGVLLIAILGVEPKALHETPKMRHVVYSIRSLFY